MAFRFANNPDEVLDLLKSNIELAPNSCLVQDPRNFRRMSKSFRRGFDHYALYEATDVQGYARIIDVFIEDSSDQIAVLDLLFPPQLKTYLAELAEAVRDRDYDHFFLNYDVGWVHKLFSEAKTMVRQVAFPPKLFNKIHFHGGNGQFTLLDLLCEDVVIQT